jgi:hypothetical protein
MLLHPALRAQQLSQQLSRRDVEQHPFYELLDVELRGATQTIGADSIHGDDAALLHVPSSKGQSLYQASRAATYLGLSPAPPLRPGAALTIEAALPEGLGAEAGFVAALTASRGSWEGLLTGPEPTGAGAQRAVILALLARRFHLRLRGVADPAPLRALGLDAEAALARREADVLEVKAPFVRLPQVRG